MILTSLCILAGSFQHLNWLQQITKVIQSKRWQTKEWSVSIAICTYVGHITKRHMAKGSFKLQSVEKVKCICLGKRAMKQQNSQQLYNDAIKNSYNVFCFLFYAKFDSSCKSNIIQAVSLFNYYFWSIIIIFILCLKTKA